MSYTKQEITEQACRVMVGDHDREKIAGMLAYLAASKAQTVDVDQLVALLPGPYYMDAPDGGDVSVIEQIRRMSEDAKRYRWLRNVAVYHEDQVTRTPWVWSAISVDDIDGEPLWGRELDTAIDASALPKDQ